MTTDPLPEPPEGASRPDGRRLQRATGLGGALVIGLGSILGTGVFVSLALAAQPAGEALPLAILLAALLAGANGLSAAQLAAVMPVSGGSYEYGRRLLSPLAGFAAGWLFLCAKTASAAAAALGLAAYLGALLGVDPLVVRWWPPLAVGLITAAALGGLRRSQWLNSLLVGSTLLSLLLFVAGAASLPSLPGAAMASAPTAAGLAQATALVFVAFTGYGRIATMGEEVRRPERTIPRAVLLTLAAALLLYLAVASSALRLAGPIGLASSVTAAGHPSAGAPAPPLARLLLEAGWPWGSWIVALGATLALAGVLLNLILGLSRVWMAMGRHGDMPTGLAALDAAGTSPRTAVLLSGALAALLSMSGRLELTWGFSAFTVLGYYAITNLCVLRLEPQQRRFPVVLAWLGLITCLGLAFQVSAEAWLSGLVVLGLGLLWRWGYHGVRSGPSC
ncbi:APC family permease [Cyanobium gracile]|uniref:Amino acid transporter n=1 Tax=Cyanobium gracile (strain ATCC 27147 / PCC 6307) TaxID=292564 RepID=K9P492_CYAGP|nr:APC family permease [Cyanobium gracile]AFY27349.1 amino acid transporter [Cyanobium gracile PCC 6307]